MTRLAPHLNMPPRTGATGPCKTAHLARGKESPWRTVNPSVARLPILPFCTSHHDFALLGLVRSGCNKAAMSNASLISSNEVIKWHGAKCAAAVIGSTALAWVHNGAATADQGNGTNYVVRKNIAKPGGARKGTQAASGPMSALSHKRTFAAHKPMLDLQSGHSAHSPMSAMCQ